MRSGLRRVSALAVGLFIAGTACGGGTTSTGASSGDLLVFAAASLTESFTQIGAAFERARPGARVRFNFGPSDGLATGIREGARADVFASASPASMDVVARSPGVSDRTVFARNRLTLIVTRGGTRAILAFADLARPGTKLVLAAPGVPAGAYARQALQRAGLSRALRNVVSNEVDVKSVVQKVVLGEADAGIVYETDVTAGVASRVHTVPIPDPANVSAAYPIAVVAGTPHAESARSFIRFVLAEGRAILDAFRFLPPT